MARPAEDWSYGKATGVADGFAAGLLMTARPVILGDMDVIAEYRLHFKYPDGELVPVWLRIGRPVELPTGNWDCEAEIEGNLRVLYSASGSVPGGGMAGTSWQALAFAMRSLYRLIRAEVEMGGAKMYSQSGHQPIHFDELFPLLRDWESPPPAA